MSDDEIYIGRKRTVFVEKSLHKKTINNEILSKHNFSLLLNFNREYFRKNKFVLEMQIDNDCFESSNIQGFNINHFKDGNKTICVNTYVHTNEWIDEYSKVNIIKIYLLDASGDPAKQFDFDVNFNGYTFDCNYKDDGFATPNFIYKILE